MKPLALTFQSFSLLQRCITFNYHHNKTNIRRKADAAIEGNNINTELLKIINFKTTKNTNWIVENKVKSLCKHFINLNQTEKEEFILLIASKYSVNHEKICEQAKKLSDTEATNLNQLFSKERALKDALTPPYHWLFRRIGRLDHGIKFLVDLRKSVLGLISQSTENSKDDLALVQMDETLKDLLLFWFSVGFMKVERITWQTSCDILQKISDYEAIHPMKNWIDLKKRVGPYKRCFIFTHPSMPREPLVVLHTALCNTIPDSVKGIQQSENGILGQLTSRQEQVEDKTKIKAAIFYSIASTQIGLQGIELGNYLIKEVAKQITSEFPMINQLSSLSPIPNFRIWLLDKMKRDINIVFVKKEQENIMNILNNTNPDPTLNLYLNLKKILSNSLWSNNKELADSLKEPLLRSCAWYLYREKRRNYCLNNVANFHLRNGAVMWRLNWLADTSPRGMANSCGIMVNYRYYLEDTESNSINYIENYNVKASKSIRYFAKEAEKLFTTELDITKNI